MTKLVSLALVVYLIGCSDETGETGTETDTGVDLGTDQDEGDSMCEPTPSRCDSLGSERPGRLSEHSAAFDDQTGMMVVFGGLTSVPQNCGFPESAYVANTWLWDDACGAWTQVSGQAPPARGRQMSAASPGAAWIFGGRYRADGASGAYTLYSDLWRYDTVSQTWEEQASVGTAPSARINGGFAYDSSRDRLWLVGGNESTSGAIYLPLMDVYYFDINAGRWEQVNPTGTEPADRLFHSMTYDTERDRLVFFGGADETAFNNDAQYFQDLWALNLADSTWELLNDSGPRPDGRFWGQMVHDTQNDVYILMGGHDALQSGSRNDVWQYRAGPGDWGRLTDGDEYNPDSAAPGFCDFPADFTIVEASLPERRNAHTIVWNETCQRAITFGGKTDCGAVDDVWRYSDGNWTEMLEATEGEVCHRWRSNPDNCVGLCL